MARATIIILKLISFGKKKVVVGVPGVAEDII